MKISDHARAEASLVTSALSSMNAQSQVLTAYSSGSGSRFRSALERAQQRPREKDQERVRPRTEARQQSTQSKGPEISETGTLSELTLNLDRCGQWRARSMTGAERKAGESGVAAELFESSWRRRAGGAAASSCIEVVHGPSGTRFVLSRENGVWLLAVDSGFAGRSSELQSFLSMLRENFASRGLGDIDVIMR